MPLVRNQLWSQGTPNLSGTMGMGVKGCMLPLHSFILPWHSFLPSLFFINLSSSLAGMLKSKSFFGIFKYYLENIYPWAGHSSKQVANVAHLILGSSLKMGNRSWKADVASNDGARVPPQVFWLSTFLTMMLCFHSWAAGDWRREKGSRKQMFLRIWLEHVLCCIPMPQSAWMP